jgi:hypothetical protein
MSKYKVYDADDWVVVKDSDGDIVWADHQPHGWPSVFDALGIDYDWEEVDSDEVMRLSEGE